MNKICPICSEIITNGQIVCQECYEKEKMRLEAEIISAFNEPELRALAGRVLKAMEVKK